MGNHDSYSDPSGGDYTEGKQLRKAFFCSLLVLISRFELREALSIDRGFARLAHAIVEGDQRGE